MNQIVRIFACIFVVTSGLGCPDVSGQTGQREGTNDAHVGSKSASTARKEWKTDLESDPKAVQRVLLDPKLSEIRDTPEFREAVYAAAIKHKVSQLTLAPPDEPGEWIEIFGQTVVSEGNPLANTVFKIFATDKEGRYHPTVEGEALPRLFGTVVSDAEGRFSIRTVRPGPYPGTRNARHIHFSARWENLRPSVPGYAVFDDDPLLSEPQNAEQRGEAIRIKMGETVDGVKRGTLIVPMR